MGRLLFDVLRTRKYAAIAVLSAAAFFAIYVYSQVLFIAENLDVWFASVPRANLVLSLLFAALFGATLSYQVYLRGQPKTCSLKKSGSVFGTSTFIGMLVAQCPACASLGALFLPAGAFAFVSSNSTLINFVSIGLMLFALNYLGAFRKSEGFLGGGA